ncbi:TetR family transcriptional regulator [Amycolatopsis coloradensis]|uniref:TetR family transcriptional regulator n=1 Tax=Amycolatopsis coloradensis TaxID=76021 RepID=A0A1R0KED0_9PSEU|nr:TetR/AcrR family transcriptional regulator [Amycolatopsis coloradensis]OLZ43413.1 TetR family transcriptional regulator [Amycolatopsis coloradensis]
MPTQARERLLQAAEELFYAEGIRAVGVERLLAVSGVGRASFYRHFASKDDLVITTVRNYSRTWLAWLAGTVTARDEDPLAVFDALAERFAAADYRGCVSINTMVEAADPNIPTHQVAADHKTALTAYIRGLLDARGHTDTQALAEQFVLLIDGSIVTALRDRTARPAQQAKAIAAGLLERNRIAVRG